MNILSLEALKTISYLIFDRHVAAMAIQGVRKSITRIRDFIPVWFWAYSSMLASVAWWWNLMRTTGIFKDKNCARSFHPAPGTTFHPNYADEAPTMLTSQEKSMSRKSVCVFKTNLVRQEVMNTRSDWGDVKFYLITNRMPKLTNVGLYTTTYSCCMQLG